MHEFILYSQIPATRHDQILQILTGVTAAQPVKFSEQQIVYQQIKSTEPTASKKGQMAQTNRVAQLSYSKLTRECTAPEDPGSWKVRKEEQPLAGLKDVISRSIAEHVATEAELERFKQGSEWYRHVTQFFVKGDHFVQDNVVVRILRVYAPKDASAEDPITLPPLVDADAKALDGSGAYIVEASIRTTDESSSELREKARKELLAFSKSLEGAIDFYAPDRLVMDTRVKGN